MATWVTFQGEPKEVPKTIDSMRVPDDTIIDGNDVEVQLDEATDEFAPYFLGALPPKLLITTNERPSKPCVAFAKELQTLLPKSDFEFRRNFPMKAIVEEAITHEYTDLVVVHSDKEDANRLLLMHLPNGPTAHFKLSSVKLSKKIRGHAKLETGQPELILNRFGTRLGRSIGRMLAALFPQDPNFPARTVATFHNQRDFIFFRHHRYLFDEEGKKTSLQEIGPQFTLKLKTLQVGTFSPLDGLYEWTDEATHRANRRTFAL